jgi:hypothetical protein
MHRPAGSLSRLVRTILAAAAATLLSLFVASMGAIVLSVFQTQKVYGPIGELVCPDDTSPRAYVSSTMRGAAHGGGVSRTPRLTCEGEDEPVDRSWTAFVVLCGALFVPPFVLLSVGGYLIIGLIDRRVSRSRASASSAGEPKA